GAVQEEIGSSRNLLFLDGGLLRGDARIRRLHLDVGGAHRQPNRERRAFRWLTFHGYLAAKKPREASRDREPKTSAALHRVAPRTGVDLLELVEDSLLIRWRDADACV